MNSSEISRKHTRIRQTANTSVRDSAPLLRRVADCTVELQSNIGWKAQIVNERFQSCVRVLENRIRSLFSNHVDGARNEKSRNARKDRCIDYSQPLCAVDAKAAIEYASSLARADCAGTGSMMPPGIVPYILA